MKIPYQHTQSGRWIFGLISLFALFPLLLGAFVSRWALLGCLVIPVLLFMGWMFRSLTIRVDESGLSWWFGGGWVRRSVKLAPGDVKEVQKVRTQFVEGWGMHGSRFGMLYNICGFDAVAITLRNGERFALGTDDPETLMQYLKGMASH